MKTVKNLLANAKVRLALRAVVAGVTVVATKYVGGGTNVHALIVAGVLAFVEVFTPLNSLVGLFKTLSATPKP